MLQVNLCNSGVAGCYAGGQSIPETAALVRAYHPDVLTLNEVCRGDGDRGLVQAMRQSWPGDRTFQAFAPAWDQRRQAPYLCQNGEQYGVGIIGHIAQGRRAGVDLRGGRYPVQDATSDEARAWLCVRVVGSYDACTTHLAANAAAVAMAQCRHLMGTAIPRAWADMGGYSPTVVAGDLNVRHGGEPDVQDCVPAGWLRTGDGEVQHVMATGDSTVRSTGKIAMRHTDHDAWLVVLSMPAADTRRRRRRALSARSSCGAARMARRLLADPAVDALAQQVRVPAVPRVLLDHVHQHVPQ